MKILFDHQVFIWHKRGGISRVFTELVSHMSKIKNIHCEVALLNNFNSHLQEAEIKNSFFNTIASNSFLSTPKIKEYLDYIDTYNTIYKLKKQKFDVFIPTLYETYFLPYLNSKPFVITIHDMIHEMLPEYFNNPYPLINQKKELIFKATQIAVVSENTKTDLLKIYPEINPDKIYVTYINHSIKPITIKIKHKLPNRYILYVGERDGYKNFNFFIQAMSKILKQDKDLSILCIGGKPFSIEDAILFQQLNIQNQIMRYVAADNELYTIYNNALVFVFPSLYEGFGLPIIEAMTSNCPVVLTNTTIFKEIAQDAAMYFNIGNEHELIYTVSEIIYNNKNRNQLLKKGIENANRFSWEKVAEKYIEVCYAAIK